MSDASDSQHLPDTTCPSCGSVQPPARRCRDCGAVLPWARPRPVFQGREKALASAGRRRTGSRWTWIAGSAVAAAAGVLVAVPWPGGPPAERPVAQRAAELTRNHPEFLRRVSADPQIAAQVRAGLEQALQSGASGEDAMAQAEALLHKLRVERHFADIAATAAAPATAPDRQAPAAQAAATAAAPTADTADTADTAVSAAHPDAVALGATGQAIGVERLPTRKCFGTGEDAECIDLFDDPSLMTESTNPADVRARLEALRRKAEASREILKGL